MTKKNWDAQIQKLEGTLVNNHLKIDKIITTEQATVLKELLADENLQVNHLEIKTDDKTNDKDYDVLMFAFKNISPDNYNIKTLSLPSIQLSHNNWEIFFQDLQKFKSLELLDLSGSNFHYTNDLNYLGIYLGSNPTLKEINLYHFNYEKMGDNTFSSGEGAMSLLNYLKTNTHLVVFKYADPIDVIIQSNLSKQIQQKLKLNASNEVDEQKIAKVVGSFKNDDYLKRVQTQLDSSLISRIKELLPKEPGATNTFKRPSTAKLKGIISVFQNDLNLAKKSEDLKDNEYMDQAIAIEKYYVSQDCLLDALDKMYQQESKASNHDKKILNNLREDLLFGWNKVTEVKNVAEKNKAMQEFIDKMKNRCETDAVAVKDKSSSGLIKNVLLILASILTAGIALGIYAALTQQSRSERGSFFFQDTELSKNRIKEVKKNLEEIPSIPEIKKSL